MRLVHLTDELLNTCVAFTLFISVRCIIIHQWLQRAQTSLSFGLYHAYPARGRGQLFIHPMKAA